MKLHPIPFVAVVMLALAGAGCQSSHPETGPYPPQSTTGFDAENKDKFVLMDSGAQYSVTCTGLQETTLPDGRMQIAANVRNRENRRIQVQISCAFKDEQGFTIDETPYQTLILTENGQETVSFTSLNNKPKKYTVRVRQAR